MDGWRGNNHKTQVVNDAKRVEGVVKEGMEEGMLVGGRRLLEGREGGRGLASQVEEGGG